MDEIDEAQQNKEFFRQLAMSKHLSGRQDTAEYGDLNGAASCGSGTHPHRVRYCQDCGDQIEEARLQVMPFAIRCTVCQDKKEKKQRGLA